MSNAGSPWSQPASAQDIASARLGIWDVRLAGKSVPKHWFGDIKGKDILCLASGGGQQAPTLAAAGANVTSFDLSDAQLEKDDLVAQREGLEIRLEQGDMADLSRFDHEAFDLIFLPPALTAIPDVQPVWRECHRVLRSKCPLLVGLINPLVYLFEDNDGSSDQGLSVVNELPFCEFDALTPDARRAALKRNMVFEWSHSLESLIGGQLAAGFSLTDFCEGHRTDDRAPLINRYCPTYIATRACKGASSRTETS